jgi:hypothetical protein
VSKGDFQPFIFIATAFARITILVYNFLSGVLVIVLHWPPLMREEKVVAKSSPLFQLTTEDLFCSTNQRNITMLQHSSPSLPMETYQHC